MIDVTDSLTMSRLALSPLFMDPFGRSFYGFATYILIRKLFLMVAGVKMAGIGGRVVILSDFIELSF